MLKPKVIMQAGRAMFLNDELKCFLSRAPRLSGGELKTASTTGERASAMSRAARR